jgi:hypothetical protein
LIIGAIVTKTHNIYYTFWSFLIVMIVCIGVTLTLKHPTKKVEEGIELLSDTSNITKKKVARINLLLETCSA